MQSNVIDFVAISLGIFATLRPASPFLFPDYGRCRLSHPRNYIQVAQTVLVTAIMYIVVTHLLYHESWFKGGNSIYSQVTVVSSVLLTVACLLCNSQDILQGRIILKLYFRLQGLSHTLLSCQGFEIQ